MWKDYKVHHNTLSNQAALGLEVQFAPVTATVGNLMPALVQGLGEADRTGDTVSGSLSVDYVVNALPYHATTNPDGAASRMLRVMIGYLKATPTTAPVTGDFDDLLRSDNTAIAWTGIPTDELRPLNHEKFTIIHNKTYQMGGPVAAIATVVSTVNSSNQGHLHIRGHCNAFKDKKLTFNDTVSNFPQNAGLFIWSMFYRTDGSTEAATIVPYQLATMSNLRYTN